jgi:hypothetical protein
VGVLVSGGTVDLERFARLLGEFPESSASVR